MEIKLEKKYVGVEDTKVALEKLEYRYLSQTLGTRVRYDEETEKFVVYINDNVLLPYSDLYERGVECCKSGNFGKAIEILSHIVTACPVYIDAFTNLAQAYNGKEDTNKAIDCLIQALMLDPNNTAANTVMGNTLMIKGQAEDAIKYYNSALETSEEKVYIIENLATAYLKLGNYGKTIELCRELKEKHYVNDYFVFVTKSMALEGIGQQTEALACCIDALRWGFADTTMNKKDLFDYVYSLCDRLHSDKKDQQLVRDMENMLKNVFKKNTEYNYTSFGVGLDGKYEILEKSICVSLNVERGYENDVKLYNLKKFIAIINEAMYGKHRFFYKRGFDVFLDRFWRDSDNFLNNISEEEQDTIRHNYHDYLFEQVIDCIDSFYVNFDYAYTKEITHMGFIMAVRKIKAQVQEIRHLQDIEIITDEYKFILRSLCYAGICQFRNLYGYDFSYIYKFEDNDKMFGNLIWDTFDKSQSNRGSLSPLKSSLISLFNLDNIIETREC